MLPKKNIFAKNTFSIAAGTIIAQIITFGTISLIAKLYTVSDFGMYSILIAYATIGSTFLSWRSELAIVLEKARTERDYLKAISFILSVATGIVALCLYLIISKLYTNTIVLKIDQIGIGIVLSYMLLLCWANILKHIALAHNFYNLIAITPVIQAIAFLVSCIYLPALLGNQALAYSAVAACFTSVIVYAVRLKSYNKFLVPNITEFKKLIRKYRDVSLFGTPTVIIDTIVFNYPILWLATKFDALEVGLYAMVVRVAYAPFSVFSASISQIHFKTYSDRINQGQNLIHYLLRIFAFTLIIGMLPTLIFKFYGQELFVMLFGQEWAKSGQILETLAVAILIKFIASTLSPVFEASNRMSALFSFKVITSLILIFFFAWHASEKDMFVLIEKLANLEIIISVLFLVLIFITVKMPKSRTLDSYAQSKISNDVN